jgi:hypothetical protein
LNLIGRANRIWTHNDNLHNLYFTSDNSRAIKSRWMKWTGRIDRMEQMSNTKFLF